MEKAELEKIITEVTLRRIEGIVREEIQDSIGKGLPLPSLEKVLEQLRKWGDDYVMNGTL